ncbi:ATP phosphoribosyltransferase [Pyrrhoderma noxium]|uniref:ATP phosphoribosyltransferase n=1 Tax=Pyrrhoderma noxium TaxID=2282107 RepID=A0A286UBB2_9AGAM|nr:ATP phosphoribosyltransferase [Pyrrhoderma noxium]
MLNLESLDGRLLFAIPKKGRLHEKCLELLSGADIQFRRHNRLDVCLVQNHQIALVFLPASDIPSFVGKGNVDLGITGHDVILEANMQEHVTEVAKLGFGKCALQVQVPEAGSIKGVKDLAGKRVVTSFEVLAGEYFKKIDDELGLEGEKRTQIEYVGGSVEAACALGLADGIVDLVESGDTMRAAGLHAIATVLPTEAVLIKSSKPKHAHLSPLIDLITKRIEGVIASTKYVLCQYNIPRDKLPECMRIAPGRRAPTVSPLEESNWVACRWVQKTSYYLSWIIVECKRYIEHRSNLCGIVHLLVLTRCIFSSLSPILCEGSPARDASIFSPPYDREFGGDILLFSEPMHSIAYHFHRILLIRIHHSIIPTGFISPTTELISETGMSYLPTASLVNSRTSWII